MVVPWLSSQRPCLGKASTKKQQSKVNRNVAIRATKKKIAPPGKCKPNHVRLHGQPAAPGGLPRQPAARAVYRIRKSKQAALPVPGRMRFKPKSRAEVLSQKAGSRNNERDMCLLGGSVDEIDVEHARRHACSPAQKDIHLHCPRCLWLFCKADVERVAPWVGLSPRHLGEAWALGCRICFVAQNHTEFKARRQAHMSENAKHGFCKQAISRTGKWCHYQVRVGGSPWFLKQRLQAHACTDSHLPSSAIVSIPRYLLGSAAPLRKATLLACGVWPRASRRWLK